MRFPRIWGKKAKITFLRKRRKKTRGSVRFGGVSQIQKSLPAMERRDGFFGNFAWNPNLTRRRLGSARTHFFPASQLAAEDEAKKRRFCKTSWKFVHSKSTILKISHWSMWALKPTKNSLQNFSLFRGRKFSEWGQAPKHFSPGFQIMSCSPVSVVRNTRSFFAQSVKFLQKSLLLTRISSRRGACAEGRKDFLNSFSKGLLRAFRNLYKNQYEFKGTSRKAFWKDFESFSKPI